ncbi:MFS transporter [Cytobacillus pseudoceanisediminis]|uniref:MFS transporter n=1 Tax=Cytobacillus pseudoceanisediminis TaxID=3051614 RepID=UPI0036601403
MKLLKGEFAKLLFSKNYGFFFLGGAISFFGTGLTRIALPILILEKTGSGLLMGLAFAIEVLPATLLGPFLGALTDKFNRKKSLIVVDLLRAFLILGILLSSNLYLIFTMLALIGVLKSFYAPIRLAVAPDIVPRAHFPNAVSLNGATQQISNIIGPSLAGILIAFTSTYVVILIDLITYLIAAILTLFIKIPQRKLDKKDSLGKHIKEGFQFLYRNKLLRKLNFYWIVLEFAFGGLQVLLLLYLQEVSMNKSFYGLLMTWLTVGIFTGTVLGPKIIKKRKWIKDRLINILPLSFTLLYCALIFDLSFFPLVLFITVLGFLYGTFNILASVDFGLAIPSELRGRVYSNANAFTTLSFALSTVLTGATNEYFKVSTIFFMIGILCSLLLLIIILTHTSLKTMFNNKKTIAS